MNAAGFYAVGVFSSNMTVNVSSLADHLALADLVATLPHLGLVAAFVLGTAASAVLLNAGRRRGMAHIYALSILAEAALLAGLACAVLLSYGLSFLMGMQNVVVTRISDARVRTTHVTGMVTDIGIELGNLLNLAWHRHGGCGRDAGTGYNAGQLLHGVRQYQPLNPPASGHLPGWVAAAGTAVPLIPEGRSNTAPPKS